VATTVEELCAAQAQAPQNSVHAESLTLLGPRARSACQSAEQFGKAAFQSEGAFGFVQAACSLLT